jgi:Rad3-related DNA helicase
MTELNDYLSSAGFSPRRSQTELYDHLITATHDGVIAQAGTGTGKSAAIISAAAHQSHEWGTQSIIVTPTLTLMNQYRDGDLPIARQAFDDLLFAEVRGRTHYICEMARASYQVIGLEYRGGCEGSDGGCTQKGWAGHGDSCALDCDIEHEKRWECGYQQAKHDAKRADVVVTNADMLIVNDRLLYALGAEIFNMEGDLFVDEAHTLEQKLRDYASRSLWWKSVERFKFAGDAPKTLAKWIERQDKNIALKDTRGFPMDALTRIAQAEMPSPRPKDGLAKQRETQEACARVLEYINNPHDNAVLHVNSGSLKYDWINVSKSAGELLSARRFGLVSATIPKTMAATLGVAGAPFIDVGHPFDYANQAWLGISPYAGDYRSAQAPGNLDFRINEVRDLIGRSKGGALILFSSFRDLETVSAALRHELRAQGLTVLIQDREMDAAERQDMAEQFKADGNAVLFGSESFATGFDVPGDALRLVVIWKLPYPAVDPVSNAIRAQSYQRYEDIMKVRAVQAIGRLIRRETDVGIVWLADSRGRRLLDSRDPLTSHLPQFARI